MNRLIGCVAVLGMLLCAPVNGRELTPFSMELEGFFYQAWVPIKITGTQTLEHRGDDRWRMRLEARGPFIRMEERADFRWVDGRPVPEQYRYELEAPFEEEKRRVLFQREEERIRAIVDDRITDHPLNEDWLDPMSYILLLMDDSRKGTGPWEYEVVDRHDADTYRFEPVDDNRVSGSTRVVEQVHPKQGVTYTLVNPELAIPTHFLRWEDGKLQQQIRTLSVRIDGTRHENLRHWPNPRRESP